MHALCQKCGSCAMGNMKHDWLGGEAIIRCRDCNVRVWEAECAYEEEVARRTRAKSDWIKHSQKVAELTIQADGETDRERKSKLVAKIAEATRKMALAEEALK